MAAYSHHDQVDLDGLVVAEPDGGDAASRVVAVNDHPSVHGDLTAAKRASDSPGHVGITTGEDLRESL